MAEHDRIRIAVANTWGAYLTLAASGFLAELAHDGFDNPADNTSATPNNHSTRDAPA
jgi:hypothetical protein